MVHALNLRFVTATVLLVAASGCANKSAELVLEPSAPTTQ